MTLALLGCGQIGAEPGATLPGKLFYHFAGEYYRFDFSSGRSVRFPKVAYDMRDFDVSADGQKLLLVREKFGDNASSVDTIHLETNSAETLFKVTKDTVWTSARFSPNGSKIALTTSAGFGKAAGIHVHSRDGQHLVSYPSSRDDLYHSVAWLADGRLLMSFSDGIYLTKPDLLNADLIADVQNTRDLSVSPDSQWVAFYRAGHVWRMRPDGSGLKQLTASDTYEMSPQFSPDGRFIALRVTTFVDRVVGPAPGFGELYNLAVIPNDGKLYEFKKEYFNNAGVLGYGVQATNGAILLKINDGRSTSSLVADGLQWRP